MANAHIAHTLRGVLGPLLTLAKIASRCPAATSGFDGRSQQRPKKRQVLAPKSLDRATVSAAKSHDATPKNVASKAVVPNAVGPNAVVPDAVGPNAVVPDAVGPNAVVPDSLARPRWAY